MLSLHLKAFIVVALIACNAVASPEVQIIKCTESDTRVKFKGCVLDYRDMTLWCDLTNLTRLPQPENIKSQAPCSKSSYLYMNDSCVDYLDPDVLSQYTRLETINFSDNLLKEVTNGTFQRQSNLQILDLSINLISNIQADAFSGLINLKSLDLSHNQLSWIASDVFQSMPNLEKLFLDSNSISDLNYSWFFHLKELRTFTIANNQLTSWNYFNSLRFDHLKILNLEHNQLEKLHKKSFQDMPNLEQLSLRGNKLQVLENGIFDGTPKLQSIDLAENELQKLAEQIFVHLCFVNEVDLSKNHLSTANTAWFINIVRNNHPSMTSQLLINNRWACDCKMVQFWAFVSYLSNTPQHNSEVFNLQCSSPSQYEGRHLLSLTKNELELAGNCSETKPGTSDPDLKRFLYKHEAKRSNAFLHQISASKALCKHKSPSYNTSTPTRLDVKNNIFVSLLQTLIIFMMFVMVLKVMITSFYYINAKHKMQQTNKLTKPYINLQT